MSRQRSNAVFASLQPPSAACDRSQSVKRVPYFRGAEVAITRNAVDQRYVEQKRFRERCANELAVRKACSFQRGFLQVYVEQSQCSKTQSMNAARSSAMPLMRQPVKRQFRNVSPGKSPSVSVRFSNRTNSTSVSLHGPTENSAARSAQGEYCSCGVLCFISTREYSTYGNARTTNKKTTPEECMLKNPTQVNHCVHLSDSML